MGRGPWAGPVVAAACHFPEPKNNLININIFHDSKKISKKKREECFEHILNLKKKSLIEFYIGESTVKEIDKLNILQASLLAMTRAINCFTIKKTHDFLIIVDGKNKPDTKNIKCETIIKGDNKSISIAAASIIAKIHRDKIMKKLSINFPGYGWDTNMGYGTSRHIQGLKSIGITKHHRKNFSPIRNLIQKNC